MSDSPRKDNSEQAEFREYCRTWLAANRPPDPTVRLPLSALEIMTDEQLSYLQAWHERRDDKVWIFIGTYYDSVTFVPGSGWRIRDMKLQAVAGETRYRDSAVGKAQ